MRTATGAGVIYANAGTAAGAGQRTDFIQSSSVSELVSRLLAIAASLAALPNTEWNLIFANLAGGGSGTEFVLELRWADDDVVGLTAGGIRDAQLLAFGAAGAQSAANQLNFDTALAAFQAPNVALNVFIAQTLFAGASQGMRVADMALAGDITPPP